MLKAWFVSFFILLLLGAAMYFGIFEWLASGSAKLVGLALLGIVMIAAFIILGNPFGKKE